MKIFTDPSMTRDAYPALREGEAHLEARGDHSFLIVVTSQLGCDTGRRRYRVVCRTCRVVVHPATTGPRWQIETHVKWFDEDGGKPTPFPGTEIGCKK